MRPARNKVRNGWRGRGGGGGRLEGNGVRVQKGERDEEEEVGN